MDLSTAQLIAILLGFLSGSVMIAVLVFGPPLIKKITKQIAERKAAKAKAAKKTSADTPAISGTLVHNAYISSEMNYAFGALMVGFLFCSVTIVLWRLFARDTLVWFSMTEIVWYLVGFFVYAVQKIVKERKTSGKQ
jgi:hypothetical protein